MNKYFSVVFQGKSYCLPTSLHKLERDEIEYCIKLVHQGYYSSILEAAIDEFYLQVAS